MAITEGEWFSYEIKGTAADRPNHGQVMGPPRVPLDHDWAFTPDDARLMGALKALLAACEAVLERLRPDSKALMDDGRCNNQCPHCHEREYFVLEGTYPHRRWVSQGPMVHEKDCVIPKLESAIAKAKAEKEASDA